MPASAWRRRPRLALGTTIAGLVFIIGCGGSHQLSRPPAEAEQILLQVSDLPSGWSRVSDAFPPGYSINNGGPIGRYQVATCLEPPLSRKLVITVSDDFGADDQRAWDVIVTNGDLSKVFTLASSRNLPPPGKITTNPPDCFPGILATESAQADPIELIGHGIAYGQFGVAPVDLGSYGLRTSSQEVTLPYTTGGEPIPGELGLNGGQRERTYLDVAVVQGRKAVIIFGFWSKGHPPARDLSKQVIQSIVARLK